MTGRLDLNGERAAHHQGDNNVFYGRSGPAADPPSAAGNLAMGVGAMAALTTGGGSVAIGNFALGALSTGNDHTAVGVGALQQLAGGVGCTAVGRWALRLDTAGGNNTACGDTALRDNRTGLRNCGLGYAAALSNSSGSDIVALGVYAGGNMQARSRWVAIGSECLLGAGAGDDQVAVGYRALHETAGAEQTAVGAESLRNDVGGTRNTAIGFRSGQRSLAGRDCVFVGHQSGENPAQKTDAVNSVAIGANSWTSADNQISLGDANIQSLRCAVSAITSLSDARDKSDIRPLSLGLDFIRDVEPVEYRWRVRGGSARDGQREVGITAQQLQESLRRFGAEWVELVGDRDPDRLEAAPMKLLFPLIRAVQELADEVERLKLERTAELAG